MNITELNGQEQTALVGLLAYMIDADGRIAREEALELIALEAEMEVSNLTSSVGKALDVFEERGEILAYAAKNVRRKDARELIHVVLHDLAVADGNRVRPETDLLDDLTLAWAKAG